MYCTGFWLVSLLRTMTLSLAVGSSLMPPESNRDSTLPWVAARGRDLTKRKFLVSPRRPACALSQGEFDGSVRAGVGQRRRGSPRKLYKMAVVINRPAATTYARSWPNSALR